VVYQIDRTRDGGSFTTRRVVAMQNGKQILTMSASFHIAEEGWQHQHEMPKIAGPEGLAERAELRAEAAKHFSEKHRDEFTRPRPIEIREVAPRDFFNPEPTGDTNYMWFRMPDATGTSPAIQQCLLAYASDLNLLGSSLRPHGLTWWKGGIMTTSLDHAMWFHAPVQFEDWHLYSMDSPFSGGARGFNRGSIFAPDGRLVASVAQEGLMRKLRQKT
jgi:acyl-CoA thioesterase-2